MGILKTEVTIDVDFMSTTARSVLNESHFEGISRLSRFVTQTTFSLYNVEKRLIALVSL